MNVYDFDKTIFYPDSSYCFYMFCLKKYPLRIIKTFPHVIPMLIKYKSGRCTAGPLKEQVFSFLSEIENIDDEVDIFWSLNIDKLEKWYLEQKKPDDIIISASPEFLLKPVADKLGFVLIGTPMDKHTGKIDGVNCHDSEKVVRFYADYPEGHVDNFYSDSLTDTPMAKIADNAFLVNRGQFSKWPESAK